MILEKLINKQVEDYQNTIVDICLINEEVFKNPLFNTAYIENFILPVMPVRYKFKYSFSLENLFGNKEKQYNTEELIKLIGEELTKELIPLFESKEVFWHSPIVMVKAVNPVTYHPEIAFECTFGIGNNKENKE